jgi:hypothetical protein
LNPSVDRLVKWIIGWRVKRSPTRTLPPKTEEQSSRVRHQSWDVKPIDGKITVVNGKILVTDPLNLGAFPILVVPEHPNLTVTVDGHPVVGSCVVSASNRIDVQLHGTEPSVTYTASVSPDKLSVLVEANPTPGRRLRLVDAGPRRKLTLRVEEEEIYPEFDPSSPQKILALLEEQGFRGRVDHHAIDELCRAQVRCKKAVLFGTPPTPGRPAHYQRVNIETEVDPYTGREQLPTVPEGTVVAVRVPEIQGVPGRDVYGNEIPISVKSPKLSLGPGVIEVNGIVVATRPGRVKFSKYSVDVIPELVIEQDVTVRDGKIVFDGNVRIKGNVQDGSYIRANGTVTIAGNVFHATIIGEKGVHIGGNMVSSHIWAGFTRMMHAELLPTFNQLLGYLQSFHQDYVTLLEHAHKRFNARILVPKIAALLFEQRHQALGQLLDAIVEDTSSDLLEVGSGYAKLLNLIRAKWQGVYRTGITEEDIMYLKQQVEDYLDHIQVALTEEPAPASARSATSGFIRATGNIEITASAYWAHLESGGAVTIDGCLRGGFVVADRTVRVHELGAPVGTETAVRINTPGEMIIADICHPNTMLEVAGVRRRYFLTERNVCYKGETS